ncbi:sigma-70 family RNA polymerase sigma factor [Nonomuraea sp. NPDC050540]|uniref:sigma-70 family RNA polymerase sigma factor n=1 Tax=Nonomuraea sp. NPDC050540 TaxID=3364367 RepID=UPI0037986D87
MSEPHPPEPRPPAAPRHPVADTRTAAASHATDAGFSAFYRATLPALTAFLLNHGAPLTVATDIAQDTMIKAYQRWNELTHPRAWVHTVASRALVRHVAGSCEELVDPPPEPTTLLPCPHVGADWETRQIFLHMLRRLPPRQRQILAWTFNDFTPAEIAEQLGMTSNAVSASLKKARRAAVEHLTAVGYFTTGQEAR